jgi:hypothetical protein
MKACFQPGLFHGPAHGRNGTHKGRCLRALRERSVEAALASIIPYFYLASLPSQPHTPGYDRSLVWGYPVGSTQHFATLLAVSPVPRSPSWWVGKAWI